MGWRRDRGLRRGRQRQAAGGCGQPAGCRCQRALRDRELADALLTLRQRCNAAPSQRVLCAMLAGTKRFLIRHNKGSAMKSILLPIDQSEQMPSALETAWHLAGLFESTVEGVALRPAFAEIVAPDPIVAVTIPPADWNEVEFCRGVRQTFDAFAAAHPANGT